MRLKDKTCVILISLVLTILLLFIADYIPPVTSLHWKVFGALLNIEHKIKPLPGALKDILLVTIDNESISNAKQWPYPRADFAKVIEQLKAAQPKVIAFDFVFPGKSPNQDDLLLKTALQYQGKTVLAAAINESGLIDLYTNPALTNGIPSGIITKLKDKDGVIRRSLTYLVNEDDPNKGFLSWEMQILKIAKQINLSTLKVKRDFISFESEDKEKWLVPVDPGTKSFLTHFRGHSADFPRLSFYRALNGEFEPNYVKDKIVLIGALSSLLQDLHQTSVGWLPGITLNANSFLALYTHDFLKPAPRYIEKLLAVMGVILSAFFGATLKTKGAYLITAIEIFFFFVLSYILLLHGYIWNYSLFPLLTAICPILAKKIYPVRDKAPKMTDGYLR